MVAGQFRPATNYPYRPGPSALRDWLLCRLRGPRVLDVGCGVGYMGSQRPELRWSGIEIDATACESARQYYFEVACSRADEARSLSALSGPFDEVLCCDILEHFRDPGSVLENLAVHIVPGGRVLAAIPNVAHWAVRRSLLLGRWEYADEGPLDRDHVRFFTFRTVRQLFDGAGFEVSEIGTRFVAPRALGWAHSALRRWPGLFSTHVLIVASPRPRAR